MQEVRESITLRETFSWNINAELRDVAASGSRPLFDDVAVSTLTLVNLLCLSACDCIFDAIDASPAPHTWARHALCAMRTLAIEGRNYCVPEALPKYVYMLAQIRSPHCTICCLASRSTIQSTCMA